MRPVEVMAVVVYVEFLSGAFLVFYILFFFSRRAPPKMPTTTPGTRKVHQAGKRGLSPTSVYAQSMSSAPPYEGFAPIRSTTKLDETTLGPQVPSQQPMPLQHSPAPHQQPLQNPHPYDGQHGVDADKFTNGDDVHFTYTEKKSKKKKKKKSRGGAAGGADGTATVADDSDADAGARATHLQHATLTNPDDDYPTSRVIKQAPNGDVIVERLEDAALLHHAHDGSFRAPQPNMANIWDNSTVEEQENLKAFWESLDEALKMELVKIDKDLIMDIFKSEQRNSSACASGSHAGSTTSLGGGNQHLHQGAHGHLHGHSHLHGHLHHLQLLLQLSDCPYCGRRGNVIEDELESIYDNHFDDIIDFIHEIRDINDLNALPGLLFGGFHMLEEEHKLQKLQERRRRPREAEYQEHDSVERLHGEPGVEANAPVSTRIPSSVPADVLATDSAAAAAAHAAPAGSVPGSYVAAPSYPGGLLGSVGLHGANSAPLHGNTDLQKILDPNLFRALENIDFDKIKEDISKNEKSIDLLEKVGSLREIVKLLHKADKVELEKGMSFLQSMGKSLNADELHLLKPTENLTRGLSSFADDLLKNDGKSFIEMMETLSESRNERQDLLRNEEVWVDEDGSGVEGLHEHDGECHHDHDHDAGLDDGYEHDHDDYNEEYDETHSQMQSQSIDLEVSDTESEISEEEKMQEIRRLFLIQVIKLFQERLKSAYKEKLSQDRTRKLIEELEAEENAKKEREMKKLKQKEKAKEKKRLQQLAKEEEKKKREDEERSREEAERVRLENLKEEQRKRKDEQRIKREEEKKKRLEEMRRKELEQQKRLEVQRKKEEDARKIKEERKSKAEDLKRKKEDEKRKRELLKNSREGEHQKHRTKLEKTAADEEAEKLVAQQKAILENDILKEEAEQAELSSRQPATTNHLLEQLYHAKPRSASTSTPPCPVAEPINSSGWNGEVNHLGYASDQQLQQPQSVHQRLHQFKQQSPALMTNNFAPSLPQSSLLVGSNINSFLGNSIPSAIDSPGPLFPDTFATNIAPLNNWNPGGGAVAAGASLHAGLSRSGSIWGSTSSNLWGNNSPLGANGISSPIQPLSSQTTPQASLPLQLQPLGVGSAITPLMSDVNLIQSAGLQAFQILQQTQQLEFGVAPIMKIFQSTKSVLGNSTLTLAQFLMACRNDPNQNSSTKFDYIYDDIGTVTHMKVSPSNGGTPQPVQASPVAGHSSLIGGYGEMNAFPSAVGRGLWN